jgi:hypothetical protein
VTATVANGGIVDVGQIPLGLDRNFGGPGNSVVAQSSEINPGQAAEFRVTYAYGGSSAVPATIRLGIPAGAALVPNSVTLNGAPVADPSVVDGFAEVTLPDLNPGDTGTLHYAVQTTSSTPSGPLTAIVRMRYGSSGDALIGSATTTVVGVTLAAPTVVNGLTAAVTGHAPAGSVVNVYDEFGEQVGSAIATAGGLWQATVTLANRGEGHTYSLQASTTVAGAAVRSDTQWVTHNSHSVQPTSVSISQPDGRLVSFDPSTGVARFPYVFVPGMGLNVSACFPSGTQVKDMSARIGPQLHGASAVGVLYGSASPGFVSDATPRSNSALIDANQAPTSLDSAALVGGSGGCYSAQLNPSVSELGAIYLDYTANPAPFNASELEMPGGAATESLPPALASHTGDQLVDDGNGTRTFTATLPAVDGSVTLTGTMRTVDYAPTADDSQAAAAAGVPVYGLSQSISASSDSVSGVVHAYIPQSWLQAYLPAGTAGVVSSQQLAAHAAGLHSADIVIPVAKAIEVTLNVAATGHSLQDALGAGGPYDQLSKLLDEVDNSSCADEADKQNLRNYLSNIADVVRNQQIAGAAVSLFGVIVGFGLGPIGSIVAGAAIDLAMDALQNKTLRDAAKVVHDDLAFCEQDVQVDDEVADPDWVIDPSGFTYEAVTANRLSGVTATLLQSDSPDGPFHVWDAAAYGQQNPLTTDAQGKYGWNVPFGYWKVAYTKPGYQTAYSQVFQIPPPRFDVNVGLTRIAAPTVALTRATSGATSSVTVGFDDYMDITTVTGRIAVVGANGNPVSGSVQPVDAQAAPDGKQLAKTFRFTPDQPFADGAGLTVNVDELVRDYAGHTLDAAFSQVVTATAPATPAPVSDVRAFAIDAHTMRVEWTTPADDGGSPLTGVRVTASNGAVLDLPADATAATLDGLAAQTGYTVTVAAVNAVGAGPAQSAIATTPPLSVDQAFGSFHLPPTIDGGASGEGTVTLPSPASGDTNVALSSDSPVASAPHGVTVPAGQATATFAVTTTNPVLDTNVTITATRGGASLEAPLTVRHVDVPLQATASTGSVALSWTAATDSDVVGYRVLRAVGDGDFAAVADVDGLGTTTYTDSGLDAGTTYRYRVLARFAGSPAYPWSSVAEATTPVVITPVSLSATASPAAPTYGQDVTVHVTMTPAVSGATVTVAEGATTLGSGTTGDDGTADIAVSGLHVGAHQLTVSYAGSATTTPATTTVSVTVAKAATTLTVDAITSLRDLLALVFGRHEVTARLVRASDGAPVAGQQVVIDSWKGSFCTATTDADGVARCPVPPRLRSVVLLGQVHASFPGSGDYLPSSVGTLERPGR